MCNNKATDLSFFALDPAAAPGSGDALHLYALLFGTMVWVAMSRFTTALSTTVHLSGSVLMLLLMLLLMSLLMLLLLPCRGPRRSVLELDHRIVLLVVVARDALDHVNLLERLLDQADGLAQVCLLDDQRRSKADDVDVRGLGK